MSIINLENLFEAGKKDILYADVLIKGTNISVRETLRQFWLGKSTAEILEANPGMTISDINTCFRYAWEIVGAIDFKKAVSAVNNVNKKRHIVQGKLDSMLSDPNHFLKYFPKNSEQSLKDKKE